MFDAKRHFAQVDKQLGSCSATLSSPPQSNRTVAPRPDWSKWEVVKWNAKLEWQSGEILEVDDYWERRKRNLLHTFSYHFMQDGRCIFRLDTHGRPIPYDQSCHIHIGDAVLEDGDARLHGYPLAGVTFLNAFDLVYKRLKGKKMPWE